jgi:DNA-binding CsgD family transcriptional regulator
MWNAFRNKVGDRAAGRGTRTAYFVCSSKGKNMATERLPVLSSREKQLLRRFARGKTDQRISTEIGGTARQVAALRQKLLKKLQIQSDAQLTAAADELAPWGPTKKRREDGGNRPPP